MPRERHADPVGVVGDAVLLATSGHLTASPDRPSGSDRDTESFAVSARMPSSASAASTEVAVVQ